jgi:hypothetical protein
MFNNANQSLENIESMGYCIHLFLVKRIIYRYIGSKVDILIGWILLCAWFDKTQGCNYNVITLGKVDCIFTYIIQNSIFNWRLLTGTAIYHAL